MVGMSRDDAFYYFQIARNLADGEFSTFDGGITRTNGYHPLWLLLITPCYWVFDRDAALFAIKGFEILLVAGGVALITLAARLARLPWVLMFAALPALYAHDDLIMVAGLEAAAALFMLGLFVLHICLFARNPARWSRPLAAVAFALPFARLEYIAISLASTAALCLLEWSWRNPAARALRGRAESIRALEALTPLGGAVAGVLVYFAWNQVVFGDMMPVSGAIKHQWSRQLWERDGDYSLLQNLREVLQIRVFDHEVFVALGICACLLAVWWSARRSRRRDDRLLLGFLTGVFGLASGHLAKFGQHVLAVHPAQPLWNWHYVPAYLMMVLLVPVSCMVASWIVRRHLLPRWSRMANIVSVAVVAAGGMFLWSGADFGRPFGIAACG